MPTFTALTTLPRADAARALSEALERLAPDPIGVGVLEMEDGSGLWEVSAYFEAAPDGVALALLSSAFGAAPFAVSQLPETDWVTKVKRALRPVEAGRFYVYGSHDSETVPAGRIALLIEAAMAFGTGHHGTTQGCLRALDGLADAGFRAAHVADIGAGTAVLAMAAAKLWDIDALATDIDPVAVDVARANARVNGLADRVRCVEAAGFAHPEIVARAPFDLIFANILMGPLIELAPQMAAHTRPEGMVVLSGILNDQAATVRQAYVAAGYSPVREERIVDWTTLILENSPELMKS